MEWGVIETPIALTNSLNVGLVHDALVEYMLQRTPEIGREADVILPIVGECDDSYLNDIQGRHVKREHVLQAAESATEKVDEGSVGAGTGMSALGFKAGIGTASRKTGAKFGDNTIGALVLANFGGDLHVDGVPVRRQIETVSNGSGSCRSIITVLATDAPLTSTQLRRVAARVPLALGRVGSTSANSSGDICIAFSTTQRIGPLLTPIQTNTGAVSSEALDELFRAAIEVTEEAILNSIFKSETMQGRDGNISRGLPVDEVMDIMKRHGKA
jgi:D-aminopeptidase